MMRSNSYFACVLLIRILILIFLVVSSVLILVGPGLCLLYKPVDAVEEYDCYSFSVFDWYSFTNYAYFQIAVIIVPLCMGTFSLIAIASIKCCDCHWPRLRHSMIAGTGIIVYTLAGVLETLVCFNILDYYDFYGIKTYLIESKKIFVKGYLASAIFLFLSSFLAMVDACLLDARRFNIEEL
uniref:G_PROTEIN_RECEP_F1_2 domain-containing protein n=2 Tax=Strongyloides papillosus TaxID=174720 RepID=A0A0N5BEX9_STREA